MYSKESITTAKESRDDNGKKKGNGEGDEIYKAKKGTRAKEKLMRIPYRGKRVGNGDGDWGLNQDMSRGVIWRLEWSDLSLSGVECPEGRGEGVGRRKVPTPVRTAWLMQ